MQLPNELLQSLKNIQGFDPEAFEKVHASGEQVTSIRINPAKMVDELVETIGNRQSAIGNMQWDRVPWSDYGYYLAERPSFTFDPLFHAGCYYVQEASGMFLEQVLRQTTELSKPIKVLDLCAAPGGKSTHIQSLISSDSLLVSNEVIRSRVGVLLINIIKWGCNNVIITNNDPREFSAIENYFDVIVVDAPCSGSGLFRRNHDAVEHWSLDNLQLCCHRQQRIIEDVFPALKKNGILIYSTCSYSREEDEDITDWIHEKFEVESCKLVLKDDWNIVEVRSEKSRCYGYRFFPNRVKGEGFFIAGFQKLSGGQFFSRPAKKPAVQSFPQTTDISLWINKEESEIIKVDDTLYAINKNLIDEFNLLKVRLRIQYSGTKLGALIRGKLIPDHALAMSPVLSNNVMRMELDYDESIRYLKRNELQKNVLQPGWQVVTFQKKPLGWINVLPQRINNYYPKELRILKESERKN